MSTSGSYSGWYTPSLTDRRSSAKSSRSPCGLKVLASGHCPGSAQGRTGTLASAISRFNDPYAPSIAAPGSSRAGLLVTETLHQHGNHDGRSQAQQSDPAHVETFRIVAAAR